MDLALIWGATRTILWMLSFHLGAFCVAWAAPQKRFAALVATTVAGDDATQACDAVVGMLIRRFLKPG